MNALALVLPLALLAPGPPRGRPAAPAPEPPASEAERAERIDAYLGFIHGGPSPAAWRALGPEAVPALARVARDGSAMPSRRAAAANGLSWIGGEAARATVTALAGDGAAPFSVRAAAMEGAGRLLAPGELTPLLAPILTGAGRLADRAVAAEVLARHAPAACPAVRAQRRREPEAGRLAFTQALSRCASQGR